MDYDLPGLQQGALFIIPSGLDDGKGRLFRVVKLTTSIVYPASVACEIVPEYEDTMDPGFTNDYTKSDFNLINEEDDSGNFLRMNEDLRFGEGDDGFL